ncbi:Rhodanese-like protein [Ramicandelaber brevisporus]|nr:Rhodanese-like protein [Ramicandelaber brevisporus]
MSIFSLSIAASRLHSNSLGAVRSIPKPSRFGSALRTIAIRHFTASSQSRTDLLVSTDWLAERIGANSRVKVLDGSWHMPNSGRNPRAEYLTKRIPGARFFDIDDVKDHSNPLPHMLPRTAKEFEQHLASLGVYDGDHVVVYDSVGMFSAPRVFWTFKAFSFPTVSVLQGGLPKWVAEKRSVHTSSDSVPVISLPKPGQIEIQGRKLFTAVPRTDIVSDFSTILERVAANAAGSHNQIADARPRGRFTGADPEPRAGLSSGHMSGAVSMPLDTVIEGGKLKSPEEIRRAATAAGIDLSKPITTTCGSGITASVLYLAFKAAGAPNVAVYDGSWTEYASKPNAPIVKS